MTSQDKKLERDPYRNLKEEMVVLQTRKIPPTIVEYYWQRLYYHDFLRYRLCDFTHPTWADAKAMLERHPEHSYLAVLPDGEPVIEFLMEGFTGKSAVIHFSARPENNTRDTIEMCTRITDTILTQWKIKTHTGDSEPFLENIMGITPVTNRAACIMVQKIGFKKTCVMPFSATHFGEAVDGMVTNKTREQVLKKLAKQ